MAWANNDYVEVAERIKAWYSEFPEGRIETELLEFTDVRVVVKSRVYRSGEEWPAGVGHSYLSIPGSTNFTKGSELENAETSAVGRALVMAGIPAKSVASASEIKAKKGNEHKTDWGAKSAPDKQPERKLGKEQGAGADVRGAGLPGEAGSAPCTHIDTSPLKLDGSALPKGFVRCLKCATVFKAMA